jgi:predicted CoA-substrate-specific enzyme activase
LAYAGCDLGILAAKAVIIEDGDILALEVLPYKNHPQQAAVAVMDRALAKANLCREQIDYCLATGFGEKAVQYADGIIKNVLCLSRAVRELNPRVRTVIDVGGHSFTAFNIGNSGAVMVEAITDKCAAGTGRFLDLMAEVLEMPLDELCRRSLGSTNPVYITSQCVIFAESDVISCINEGKHRFDIFAGIAHSVAGRIAALVRRINVVKEVAITGGVAKNPIVMRDLEKELGLKRAELNGVDPQVMGAYGAALLARDKREAAQ